MGLLVTYKNHSQNIPCNLEWSLYQIMPVSTYKVRDLLVGRTRLFAFSAIREMQKEKCYAEKSAETQPIVHILNQLLNGPW